MSTPSSEIGSRRLDLAGTRDFAVAGAGRARREALSAFNREWIADVWRSATGGARIEGVALAAVGSLGRAEGRFGGWRGRRNGRSHVKLSLRTARRSIRSWSTS